MLYPAGRVLQIALERVEYGGKSRVHAALQLLHCVVDGGLEVAGTV